MSRAEKIQKLIAHGLTPQQAEEFQDHSDRLDDQLNRRVCPTCGGALSRKLDGRQTGVRARGTVWFNYRCSCGYMCDRAEAEN